MLLELKNSCARAIYFIRVCYRNVLWRIRAKFQNTITLNTKQGLITCSMKDRGIARPLYVHNEYEYGFSVRCLQFLKQKGCIRPRGPCTMLDVGANIGIISLGLVRSGCVDRAIAIEPEPENFKLLRQNVLQNDLADKFVLLQTAVGESRDVLSFELSDVNPGDHRVRSAQSLMPKDLLKESKRRTINVDSIPLDDLIRRPELTDRDRESLALIWIDVQGYEGYVFKGARKILESGMPVVSEIWPYAILRAGLSLAQFQSIAQGYWDSYWVEKNGRFVQRPIRTLGDYCHELGTGRRFGNAIFTRDV